MVEPRVPKRRRPDPEPTAGSASSGTEPARHSAETLGGGISHDGATTETDAVLRKRAVRMAKDYILVGEIRSASGVQGSRSQIVGRNLGSKSGPRNQAWRGGGRQGFLCPAH